MRTPFLRVYGDRVGFDVAGDDYDLFMGRYSRVLAPQMAEYAEVSAGIRVLDLGCGPGALTSRLVELVGADMVAAVDPSEPFVALVGERLPGVDVHRAAADDLPWADGTFDVVLAQLVLNFLPDPLAGAAEMRRVARPDGIVAGCSWDYRDGMRMLRIFWDAAVALDPDAPDEGSTMSCITAGELATLWDEVGLAEVQTSALDVEVTYAGFGDLWGCLGLGVGPAGGYVVSLSTPRQQALRDELYARLGCPTGSFTLAARAWAVRGRA